ncbi:hypothetical protein H2199_004647 [Coniosporium tulheliwenetii]|uniref:Uncharacterized protein n=1 Tax=Coniosporium tulheliwenetii TaxID=3383036 RepID=A0ACC2Z607_9PEZI|nr:hypothetical protein H2199_004647 [Cladosporium sp. JES 115]
MAGLDKRLGEKMEKKAGVKLYVAVEDRKRNEKAKLRAELRTEEKAACGEGRALLAEINLSKDDPLLHGQMAAVTAIIRSSCKASG